MIYKTKQTHVFLSILLAGVLSLSACVSTDPNLGGGGGNLVSGGAAGGNSQGENNQLEKCDAPLGTASLFEDTSLAWWGNYRKRYPRLGSTTPVLRTMIQQSNCFVIVERGQAMNAMNRERQLMQSGQLRQGSNIGGGQMVAADYTINPSVQFAAKNTGGLKGLAGGLLGSVGSVIGGGVSKNEASTSLLLIDNRSGVQVSSSVGSADNYDFDIFGGMFAGFLGGGAKGFSNSPEGKVLTAAFVDSYNQMVIALRNYKPQAVDGGLGKGGTLTIGGTDDPMPQATTNASAMPIAQPSVTVTKQQASVTTIQQSNANTTVRTNNNLDVKIDAYDKNALRNYYEYLKNFSTTFSTMGTLSSASYDERTRNTLTMAVNMLGNMITSASIELDAWPLEAKREGWKVLGKRIEQYTDMFNKNKALIANSEVIEDDIKGMFANITLLTKEDFLN